MTTAGLTALKHFARPDPIPTCELCAAPIAEDHRHVADTESRTLMCACPPCHILFRGHGRYRSVPDRWARVDAELTGIPVGVAFVIMDSRRGVPVAHYPGPAGATESELSLEDVVLPADLEPDVEALVVANDEAFIVPVSAAYELAATIRRTWDGLTGGQLPARAVASFVATAKERAS
jgi:hypothetical protein